MKLIFIITNLVLLLLLVVVVVVLQAAATSTSTSYSYSMVFYFFLFFFFYDSVSFPILLIFLCFLSFHRMFGGAGWIYGGSQLNLYNLRYVLYIICRNCNLWKSSIHT